MILIISGAISYKEKSTCSTKQCPANSYCVEVFPAQCRCTADYVFNVITKRCSSDNMLIVKGMSMDMESRTAYHNTSSQEFLMLAQRVEDVLMEVVDTGVVNGIKLLKVTPGEVSLLSYLSSVP